MVRPECAGGCCGLAGGNFKYLVALVFLSFTAVLPGCDYKVHADNALTVMTYNMGDDCLPAPTLEQVVAVIRNNGVPDVLFVQDVPWAITIKDLADALGFTHFVSGRTKESPHHLGILSKIPLCNAKRIHFEPQPDFPRPAALCAEIEVHHKRIVLCSVHLATLRPVFHRLQQNGGSFYLSLLHVMYDEAFCETPHSRSVEKLLGWIRSKKNDAVIIGGDFNTFQLSKPIRAMNRDFDDALWPSMDYLAGTKLKAQRALDPSGHSKGLDLPLNPRIDYIFHSENIACLKAEVIRQTAGDHYPVRAVLGLPGSKATTNNRSG